MTKYPMKSVGEKFDVFDTERATGQRRFGAARIFAYSKAAGLGNEALALAHAKRARPLAVERITDELPTEP